MTEDQAKRKWCPMVRFHNGADGNVYSNKPDGEAAGDADKCIASECMMWQETECTGGCGLAK